MDRRDGMNICYFLMLAVLFINKCFYDKTVQMSIKCFMAHTWILLAYPFLRGHWEWASLLDCSVITEIIPESRPLFTNLGWISDLSNLFCFLLSRWRILSLKISFKILTVLQNWESIWHDSRFLFLQGTRVLQRPELKPFQGTGHCYCWNCGRAVSSSSDTSPLTALHRVSMYLILLDFTAAQRDTWLSPVLQVKGLNLRKSKWLFHC